MRLRHAKTLITGKPGVGKTTLVQKIIKQMGSVNMAGFYTSEIRSTGSRLGFELLGLNGVRRTLAHVDIDSRHRSILFRSYFSFPIIHFRFKLTQYSYSFSSTNYANWVGLFRTYVQHRILLIHF